MGAKNIIVPYLQETNGYLITAKDSSIAQKLEQSGYKMRYREGMFCLKVEKLPEISGVKFKKHNLKVPKLSDRKEIEKEYEKYVAMETAIDLMQDELDFQREKVSRMLDKSGLRLKPSLPKDSQLYMRGKGIRIHNCTTVTKNYCVESIEKATKKYPVLERCFDLKKVVLDFGELTKKEKEVFLKVAEKQNIEFCSTFNKNIYQDIEATLPPAVKKKLVKTETYQNFREIELPNPDCIHCGGHVKKDGTCRRCNLAQTLE